MLIKRITILSYVLFPVPGTGTRRSENGNENNKIAINFLFSFFFGFLSSYGNDGGWPPVFKPFVQIMRHFLCYILNIIRYFLCKTDTHDLNT